MNVTIDLGKLTDWLALIVNAAGFAVGIFVLIAAKHNVTALLLQMKSQSFQALTEAHKTLFMPFVQDLKVANLASDGAGKVVQERLLASMMINHASRIYSEISDKIIPDYDEDVFRDDLLDLFSFPIVRARWPDVKGYHRPAFVLFVDGALANIEQQA